MHVQKPTRSSLTSRFGCEIDIGIEKELRPSSVHGKVHSHLHPKRLKTEARHLGREETSKLLQHIGSPAHVNGLLQIQIFSRLDSDLAAGVRIGDVE